MEVSIPKSPLIESRMWRPGTILEDEVGDLHLVVDISGERDTRLVLVELVSGNMCSGSFSSPASVFLALKDEYRVFTEEATISNGGA